MRFTRLQRVACTRCGDAAKLKTLMLGGALATMAPDYLQSFLSIYHPSFISDHHIDFSRSHSGNDREPTPLEAFSRTIRNYVPSSIPIPSAAPSPPRVSRPVSFGSFLTTTQAAAVSPTARERDNDWKRRGSDASSAADSRGRSAGSGHRRTEPGGGEMPVFSLDDDIPEDGPPEDGKQVTRYPGVGDTEQVLWAGWDVLADVADGNTEGAKTRYVRSSISSAHYLPRLPPPPPPRRDRGAARGPRNIQE